MGSVKQSGQLFKPAQRVSNQEKDVWSIINEAAANSPVKPLVNMGQGFFGYNPPQWLLDAAKGAIDREDCNQYAPTKGRPRLKKALADSYSPFYKRQLNPETEIAVTTGANEGMLSAFMAFLEEGDEVVIFEPFFDQYISNIQMPGAKVKYVPLTPPKDGGSQRTSAADWKIDFEKLEAAFTPKTKMIVLNTPHNPIGKVFSQEELLKIGELAVKHHIIIVSDEVYDRLYYKPFTRIGALSEDLFNHTLTVGSGGKCFACTGWRVGWLIGPEHLIKYVHSAHTRICYSTPSPLQEALAIGFEDADKHQFWDTSKDEMKAKMDSLCSVFDELQLPYSVPEGGYFVLANFAKVKVPSEYTFPEHVASRPRDFKLAWFLIMELGLACIPPTEFYTKPNAHLAEDWLRFAVCKPDHMIDSAKDRLRKLKEYMH